jgi:hypothetical protein
VELLDRYLRAVKSHLPKKHQDDIVRELSENLRSKIEDREAERGRPLTAAETHALLTEHGNPAIVAARYRSNQGSLVVGRRLIGPELFPLYAWVLSINLGVTLVVCVGLAVAFAGQWPPARVISQALINLGIQFAIVTTVFSAADRHLTRHPEQWDTIGRRARDRQRPSRSRPIFELIVLFIAMLWWLGLPRGAHAFLRSATEFLTAGRSWSPFYLSVLLLTVATMLLACVAIVQPQWTRWRALGRMITHAAGAMAGFYCVGIGQWVVAVDPADAAIQRKIENLNSWCNLNVAAIAVLGVVLFLVEAWRWIRTQRAPAASADAVITS